MKSYTSTRAASFRGKEPTTEGETPTSLAPAIMAASVHPNLVYPIEVPQTTKPNNTSLPVNIATNSQTENYQTNRDKLKAKYQPPKKMKWTPMILINAIRISRCSSMRSIASIFISTTMSHLAKKEKKKKIEITTQK